MVLFGFVAECASLSKQLLPRERVLLSGRAGRSHTVRAMAERNPQTSHPSTRDAAPSMNGRHAARAVAAALFSLAFMLGSPVGMSTQAAFAANGPAVSSSDSGVGLFVNKDGNSILRLSLPKIAELPGLSKAQELAELIKLRFDQVGFKRDPVWAAAAGDAGLLERQLQELEPQILAKTPPSLKGQAEPLLRSVQANVRPLIAALREQNVGETLRLQSAVATELAALQGVLFPAQTLPYEVPAEYANLPQLHGRAEVEMKLAKGKGNKKRFCAAIGSMYTGRFGLSYSEVKAMDADMKGAECAPENTASEATIRLTLDGYHAPVTAGNFADLVQSGFYDGMPVQQLTDLSIQTGDGKKAGKAAASRVVPLEIFYKRDSKPTYSFTSDEDKRGSETMALCARAAASRARAWTRARRSRPRLMCSVSACLLRPSLRHRPFQSYGALGMARQSADLGGEIDNDSATSQFFWVKYDQALIPPGRNTLDGAYTCFGYTSQGAAFLKNLELGDVITSAKVVSGLENLKMPKK